MAIKYNSEVLFSQSNNLKKHKRFFSESKIFYSNINGVLL